MIWIQVDVGIREHDKIYNLADSLKISDSHAVGLMVCLWTWATTSAPDGDITNFPPRAIAKAAGWEKKPEAFYEAICSPQSLFVEKVEGRLFFRNWEERAGLLMEAIDRGKEQTKKRVQRYRERKAAENSVTDTDGNGNVTGYKSVTVTQGNASVTGNGNGEIVTATPLPNHTIPNHTNTTPDITDYEEFSAPFPQGGAEASKPPPGKAYPVPYTKIMELYNRICASYPRIQVIDGQRKKAVAARYKTHGNLEALRTLFEKTEESSFLKGNNERNWRADFDWLIKPTNMAKVLEGKYDDDKHQQSSQAPQQPTQSRNPFINAVMDEEV